MIRSTRLVSSAAVLALGLALTPAACGARTGLPVPDGGAGGASTVKPKPCIPGTFDLQKAISTTMFVLDRSGSMGEPLSFQSGESKWELLRQALSDTLPAVDQQLEMGVLIFPTAGAPHSDNCSVPSPPDLLPGLGHAAKIVSLVGQQGPGGRTPTSAAIEAAGNALAGTRAASSARALILATDGAPNCNSALDGHTCVCGQNGGCHDSFSCLDDKRTESTIASFNAKGIPTYVIGLGGDLQSQFGDVLNAMAVAGGRPKKGATAYYAVTSPDDLSAALIDVRDQVAHCVYLSPSVPSNGGTISIDLGGTPIAFDPSATNGWSWSNMTNGEITFSGSACTAVSQSSVPPRATVTCDQSTTSASTSASSTSQATSASGSTSSTGG